MDSDDSSALLSFFKALADETRLKMAGMLARQDYSGEELAAALALKPATISHHLSKLTEAGLVTVEPVGHAKRYRLRLEALRSLAGQLLTAEPLPAMPLTPAPANSAYDAKVLKAFLRPDGSLKDIPAHQKKLGAVLRHVVQAFTPGQRYPEKDLNLALAHFHPDTASLRRALIEFKLMERANGEYWRVEGSDV